MICWYFLLCITMISLGRGRGGWNFGDVGHWYPSYLGCNYKINNKYEHILKTQQTHRKTREESVLYRLHCHENVGWIQFKHYSG